MKMSILKQNPKRIRGAAIMLALWALFLLSAMVISWALDIDSRLSISGEGMRALKAEAAACSGSEIALHPFVNPGSSNLSGQIQSGANYEARLTGEGGRLHINYLTGRSGDAGVDVLRKYLENKGIDLNERDTMIDALLDWVQLNTGLHRLNAPPETDDYHPAHAQLTRVDELKKVAGWADFTSQPGWDDDFTVNSTGPIDMNWASRDVLLAVPGFTPNMVDRFLQARAGPDGIEGTEDDIRFKTINDVLPILGLRSEQLQQLQALIMVNDPTLRVVSVGTAGNAKRTVQMVFRRQGNVPQLITWKEF
jgi:general secretion pathway protein K